MCIRDSSNIGVIARHEKYIPYMNQALSAATVLGYMQHVLDDEHSSVKRWYMPGLNAFNFQLQNSLGGGGMASLRIDPQGKAFAQQLLDMPIAIPTSLVEWVTTSLYSVKKPLLVKLY